MGWRLLSWLSGRPRRVGAAEPPRADSVDREYWLRRCDGFTVQCDDRLVGIVDGVRFDSRHDRPDHLAVRHGHRVRSHLNLVSIADVAWINPELQVIGMTRCTWQADTDTATRILTRRRRLHRQTSDPGRTRTRSPHR
jgi:hypothetical protein